MTSDARHCSRRPDALLRAAKRATRSLSHLWERAGVRARPFAVPLASHHEGPALTPTLSREREKEKSRHPFGNGFSVFRYRCSARTSMSLMCLSEPNGITFTSEPSGRLPVRNIFRNVSASA
jgi:hypothetical protein